MEDFEDPEKAAGRETERGEDSSLWKETKTRGRMAGERMGQEWERLSEGAQEYADEHSVGVALGSFGVGIALGVLIGILVARD
jgi:ElaB/YqjD/DUF883 family membrane-anchored ribosome-binding protein